MRSIYRDKGNKTVYSYIPVSDVDGPGILRTVRVDIKAVHLFLRSFSTLFTMSRILLSRFYSFADTVVRKNSMQIRGQQTCIICR